MSDAVSPVPEILCDKGKLRITVGGLPANGVVVVKFDQPIGWFACPPEKALEVAELIRSQALDYIAARCPKVVV